MAVTDDVSRDAKRKTNILDMLRGESNPKRRKIEEKNIERMGELIAQHMENTEQDEGDEEDEDSYNNVFYSDKNFITCRYRHRNDGVCDALLDMEPAGKSFFGQGSAENDDPNGSETDVAEEVIMLLHVRGDVVYL